MVPNIRWWRVAARGLAMMNPAGATFRSAFREAVPSQGAPVPPCTVGPRPPVSAVADALAMEIDAHGSPVTVPPAQWLVCFVPGLKPQWWHPFAHARHKHVFALRRLDEERWLLVEPWWTRLMVNVLTVDQAMKFLRWASAGDVLQVREVVPGRGSQARGWSNCAVLISYMLGRSYWTWTPHGLYRRLKAEADTQHVHLPQFAAGFARIAANDESGDIVQVQPRPRTVGATVFWLEHAGRGQPAGEA